MAAANAANTGPRLEPSMSAASGRLVLLLDTSSSMAARVGERRRIDVLADILRQMLPTAPGARLVAFAGEPVEIEATAHGVLLPEPSGNTALHLAFKHIRPGRPETVIVISDGEPED